MSQGKDVELKLFLFLLKGTAHTHTHTHTPNSNSVTAVCQVVTFNCLPHLGVGRWCCTFN